MLRQFAKNSLHLCFRHRGMSSQSAGSASDTVLLNEVNKCGILTLNRPKALNALNLQMVRAIRPVLERWEATRSVVIVKSGVEKAFCAGGDVRSLVCDPPQQAYDFFREEYTLNHLIGSYRVPYVALISGITMGGGVGLSVHGRYRVATERTMFAMPETLIGLFPDVGGSHFLPRLQGQLGTYLGLTGARLKGRDVLDAGIATHYCESARLPDLELALIVCRSAEDVQRVLQEHCPVDAGSEFSLAPHLERIDRCFAPSSVEAIVAELERDGSDWAAKTLQLLRPTSPLSLKVTLRLLREGGKRTLAECLRVEHRLARRHVEASDFAEGVRAMLIDRDNDPRWQFARVEDVPEAKVDGYFAPLAGGADELELRGESSSANSKL